MVGDSELLRLSATELRSLIARKELKPTELVEASLAQVSRYNRAINAVVTINQHALEDAQRLEEGAASGAEPGLLYGLPVGIKDVTPVANMLTTFGSKAYANHVAREDALVVRRLRKAGAIILGKTNCPEFAAGGNTFNEVFGRTRNPWNPELSAGGSTGGGAAALATGMISLAEGTDLGGSLRIPASFCGVVGLRPSPGLVPTYPSTDLWDNLSVTGPLARTAEDLALFLQATHGPSVLSPVCQPRDGRDFAAAVRDGIVKGARIAYCKDVARIGIDESVESVCLHAALELSQVGAQVQEIDLDLSFARKAFLALRGHWFVSQLHHDLDKIDQFGSNVADNIKVGLKVTAEQLAAAEQTRTRLWKIFYTFFQEFDFLLTPCMAVPPFPGEQNYPETIAGKKMETYIDWIAPTFVLSMTGLPVASVPCGLDPNGLPVGLQIVGPPCGEEKVLALAKMVQDAYSIGLPPLAELET